MNMVSRSDAVLSPTLTVFHLRSNTSSGSFCTLSRTDEVRLTTLQKSLPFTHLLDRLHPKPGPDPDDDVLFILQPADATVDLGAGGGPAPEHPLELRLRAPPGPQ